MKKLNKAEQEVKQQLEAIIKKYENAPEDDMKAQGLVKSAKMKLANLLGETDTPIPTPQPSSSSGSDAISEALNSIQEALNKLNEKQREAINLYFFENLDQEESALKLGISQSSFSKRLHRSN